MDTDPNQNLTEANEILSFFAVFLEQCHYWGFYAKISFLHNRPTSNLPQMSTILTILRWQQRFKAFLSITVTTEWATLGCQQISLLVRLSFHKLVKSTFSKLVNPTSFKNKKIKGNYSSRKNISKIVYATVSMIHFNLLKQGLGSYHCATLDHKSKWQLNKYVMSRTINSKLSEVLFLNGKHSTDALHMNK